MSILRETGELDRTGESPSYEKRTLSEIFPQKLEGGKKISLYDLVCVFTDPVALRQFHRDGYFYGDSIKDLEVLNAIYPLAADDGNKFPMLLVELIRSREIAINQTAEKFPDLTPKEIQEQIADGEIADPYPLQQVEDALRRGVFTGSITLFADKLNAPVGWKQFSPDFRKYIGPFYHWETGEEHR